MIAEKDINFESNIPYNEFFDESFTKLEDTKMKCYSSKGYYCYDSKEDNGKYLNYYVAYEKIKEHYISLLKQRGFDVVYREFFNAYYIEQCGSQVRHVISNIFKYNAIPLTAYDGKIPDNIKRFVYLVRDSDDNVVGAYGFSHRMSCYFLIGDKMFPDNDEIEFLDVIYSKTNFRNLGTKTIDTIEEAIISASRFADFAD